MWPAGSQQLPTVCVGLLLQDTNRAQGYRRAQGPNGDQGTNRAQGSHRYLDPNRTKYSIIGDLYLAYIKLYFS